MLKQAIFVAATIDESLGGIARSVPALAAACSQSVPTKLIVPKAQNDTLDVFEKFTGLEIQLCDGFDGVREKLKKLTEEPASVSMIYHAGVWNSLNNFVAKLGRRTGIPVVVSTRSMLDPWALNHRKWKKRLAWWMYARRNMLSASAIHATAELEAGYIRMALREKCPPVLVVPNGVELPLADSIPNDTKAPNRLKRILFLSRLHEKKGVLDLIRAFGELNPKDWEMVIAGNDEGGYQTVCEELAKTQPNAERISFPGAVSDSGKWDLYRSADLFVLPSYSENFGIVVGEALGMGVPVITTNETPWKEFVLKETQGSESTDRDCGLWVVDPGVESIKSAIEEALKIGEERRQAIGVMGAKWIRREFSWKSIGRQFLGAVEKILS